MSTVSLEEVKNYLQITWDDPDTNQRLTGIIARGESYLEHIAGGSLDFSEESRPRALLLDYCRYANANALEDFPVNFLAELNGMRLERQVAERAEESGV